MTASTNYVPGVCNINPTEVRKRRRTGYVSISTAVIGIILFVYLHAPWPYFTVLFIPFFFGALGLLQARHTFCISYAALSKHHADNSEIVNITDTAAHKADMRRSRTLYFTSLLIALPLTILCCIAAVVF